MNRSSLTRFAWLSIAAAITTISLKSLAYWLTGSVGLLSDAVESVVNLVGALVALLMLTIAARPPDEDHLYGHSKAEYFSSGVEGALIFIAALSIGVTAVQRLLNPQHLEQAGFGLAVSTLASLVNLGVARVLLKAGQQYHSITLEADAKHLMTDVWTSVGVIGAVGAVALTGWQMLDPLIALVVAANILWSGYHLMQRSVAGLMDVALPPAEDKAVKQVLANYEAQGIQFHALLTRQAAARRFISMHVLVPDDWTVRQGHQLLGQIEAEIGQILPGTVVFTHLEPLNDPTALQDIELDH
jgi:cation diffusion facilitator family transporter